MTIKENLKPLYLEAHKSGKLREKAHDASLLLENCRLCARYCQVNRKEGKRGFCGLTNKAIVSSWGPHFGEESPLVGRHGSGTIFLASCNLLCLFCQNEDISHGKEGTEMSTGEIAGLMMSLQKKGCHNINFVTPSHQAPFLLDALLQASEKGLTIPVVWNCGGYESMESLALLEGIVDIYMPDFKFWTTQKAGHYCNAPDYPDVARRSIKEMHRQVGELVIDKDQIARRGLLVRHLVMPGDTAATGEIMKWLAGELSPRTYVNVMAQYRPCHGAHKFPEIARRITSEEYQEALALAGSQGLRLDQENYPRPGRFLF
jgi:putative pyruvate formate lyase activating enzyme